MTTITEEHEDQLAPIDFSTLLEDVSFGGTSDVLNATGEPLRPDQCPLHPDREEYVSYTNLQNQYPALC